MAEGATPARRLAVVSGASSGIGKATALQLAAQGWHVVALGRRAVPTEDLAGAPNLRYCAMDLAEEDPAEVLERLAPDALRDVQALVNCAGHDLGGGKAFHEHAAGEWRSIMRLNVEGTMRLTQACLPAMLARPGGDIVIVGSITSRRSSAGIAAYSTSKHAVRGFAQALRADYGNSGVRVVEIAPGVVRSGFADRRWHGDAARAAGFYSSFVQCLEPEDVARAVGYVLAQPPHVSVTEMVLMPTRERT